MKLIILFALLFPAFGCAPGANTGGQDTGDELFADILIRSGQNQAFIEVTFYRDIVEVLNGKTNKGFGKNVVAAESPQFNGVEMTPATNLSGQTIYKTEIANAKPSNVVTATVGGKRFQGSTMLETKMINKMTTLALSPLE